MSERMPIDQLFLAQLKERGGRANRSELWRSMRRALSDRPASVSSLFFQRSLGRLVAEKLVEADEVSVWLVPEREES